MVQLIEQIHQMKGYRAETLFLAVNIADRYLALLAVMHGVTPSLIELGVISIMLAAKINEHLSPSYYNIIKIINSQQKKKLLYRANLLAIETKVLNALSFDLHSTSILFFLERFLRVYGLEPYSAMSDNTPEADHKRKERKKSPAFGGRHRNSVESFDSAAGEHPEKVRARKKRDQSLSTESEDSSRADNKQGGDRALDGEAEEAKDALKRDNGFLNTVLQSLVSTVLKDATFLNFKPSQNAAACLVTAMNVCSKPELSEALDFGTMPSLQEPRQAENIFNVINSMEGASDKSQIHIVLGGVVLEDKTSQCPMRVWTPKVAELTSLESYRHIVSPFIQLLNCLGEQFPEKPQVKEKLVEL